LAINDHIVFNPKQNKTTDSAKLLIRAVVNADAQGTIDGQHMMDSRFGSLETRANTS